MSENEIEKQKPWEKAWHPQELTNSSNNWSLAGDAGLLLYLKKFSENFMTKAANIEKDLQKLTFDEQQCHVKFENTITNFLQLENTQFIENRVYEQDVTVLGTSLEKEKVEKTKEEKEQELLEVITESVQIGMAIMDTYFDQIDGSKLDESDDEDDQDKNEDLVIYETKDPYVLRSLPYLIGSDAYLENDHVGLKDLDDEVEEEEEEEEEEIAESESEAESESQEDELDDSESENDQLFDNTGKRDDMFEDESHEEPTNIFSGKKKSDDLFDDEPNTEPESEEPVPEEEEPNNQQQEKTLDFASELSRKIAMKANGSNQQSLGQKPTEHSKPPEQKRTDLFDNSEGESDENLFPKATGKKHTLFDDEDDEELFAKAVQSEKKNSVISFSNEANKALPKELDSQTKVNKHGQNLFDSDEESEDDFFGDTKVEIKPIKAAEKPSSLLEPLEKNLAENKKNVQHIPQASSVLQSSLFDNEQHDPEPKLQPAKIPPAVPKKINSLFDDDSEDDDLFSKTDKKIEPKSDTKSREDKQTKYINKTANLATGLFGDDNDDDDLFPKINNKVEQMSEIKKREDKDTKNTKSVSQNLPQAPKPASSLFDDDNDDDDLFSKIDKKIESKSEMNRRENGDTKDNASQPLVTTPEPASSLFDNDNDDDDDLFSKLEKTPIVNKKNAQINKIEDKETKNVNNTSKILVQTPKPSASLFDDDNDDDDLFSKQANKQILNEKKPEINKIDNSVKNLIPTSKPGASLFGENNQDDDDLFSRPVEKNSKDENLINKSDLLKPESELIKPKSVVKNVLFDPLALKSSGLFKKLAQNNESEEDSEIDEKSSKPEMKKVQEPRTTNFFADFATDTEEKKESNNQDPIDPFNSITASTTPIINTAQKDRIRAISSKKRPPTKQRKLTLENQNTVDSNKSSLSNQSKETMGNQNSEAIQAEIKSVPASAAPLDDIFDASKVEESLVKPALKQSNLFDNLNEDDDDIFTVSLGGKNKPKNEAKSQPKKKDTKTTSKSLFDNLDDDIFNVDLKVNEEKKSFKNKPDSSSNSKSTSKQEEAKKNIFDDLDDYEDIFADVQKKKIGKKKATIEDSIFD